MIVKIFPGIKHKRITEDSIVSSFWIVGFSVENITFFCKFSVFLLRNPASRVGDEYAQNRPYEGLKNTFCGEATQKRFSALCLASKVWVERDDFFCDTYCDGLCPIKTQVNKQVFSLFIKQNIFFKFILVQPPFLSHFHPGVLCDTGDAADLPASFDT